MNAVTFAGLIEIERHSRLAELSRSVSCCATSFYKRVGGSFSISAYETDRRMEFNMATGTAMAPMGLIQSIRIRKAWAC